MNEEEELLEAPPPELAEGIAEGSTEEGDYEDDAAYDNEEDENFRLRGRARGGFMRGRGVGPRGWIGPGPRGDGPRFRGRGYGPGGPPFRGGRPPPLFPRGPPPPRGGFNGPPNFAGPNWGPPGIMGPPGGPGATPPFGPPNMMAPPPMMANAAGGAAAGGTSATAPAPPPTAPPPAGPPGGPPPAMFGASAMNAVAMALDHNNEIWVETKTAEGKPYFYNARTRDTTWIKPEGSNVKIISQDQVEAIAQAAGINPGSTGPSTAAQAAQAQASTSNKIEEPDDESLKGAGNVAPTALNTMQPPPNMMHGPPPGMPPFGAPPFGLPPPGFQGSWGPPGGPGAVAGWPGMAPTPWGLAPTGLPPLQVMPSLDEAVILAQIDPEILAKGTEWTEHKSPDGRYYYYNASKGESVWEMPPALRDLEAAKAAVSHSMNAPPKIEVKAVDAAPLKGTSLAKNGEVKSDTSESEEREKMRKKQDDDVKRKKEEEEKTKEQKVQDKSRPISSTPVPGTPWCVVWTGDGRVFFYNPSSRTSVWERPDDLSGRADVDKMLATPPDALMPPNSKAPQKTKRSESESSDSGSDPGGPNKKLKIDTPNANGIKNEKKTIDIGKEAAIEAEVRAAKERAIVPLETRIKSFKEMLAEKEVSAFSTWEKELHKIVFDPRYLLLTSKERKQVFEKYVKERAEDERREKRNKLRERRDSFRKLLSDAHLHGKSSFSDFAQKYAKDERFKNVEKMREREGMFNEYIIEVRKREKEEKFQRREQVKKDFHALLREHPEVDRHARWNDVKKKFDTDPRYKAVDSSSLREEWFRDYCKLLKDEKRKAKEKDRDQKRDKDKDKDKSKAKKDKEEKKDKDSKEAKSKDEEKGKDEPMEVKEGEDAEANSDAEKAKEQKEREKQARAEASIREREKEVHRTLATHLRDRDKERIQHKRDEAVQHFNALLSDLVRNADLTWREAKRQLRKDHRWDLVELLQREEKERLFTEHIEQLLKKKREKFRELLDETPDVSLTSGWKEIKKLIKEDPRYSKFASSERCEREFKDYLKDKLVTAKAEFKELLQETKLITHKSLTQLRENENHMSEIEEILKKDRRYLVLDHIPDERTQFILNYLEELDKRGPPPPPTASEPTRRPVK